MTNAEWESFSSLVITYVGDEIGIMSILECQIVDITEWYVNTFSCTVLFIVVHECFVEHVLFNHFVVVFLFLFCQIDGLRSQIEYFKINIFHKTKQIYTQK